MTLAEAKIPNIEDRIRYRGSKYILRAYTNISNPVAQRLEILATEQEEHHSTADRRANRNKMIQQCWEKILPYLQHIQINDTPTHKSANPHTQINKIPLNTSIRGILQNAPNAREILYRLKEEQYLEHTVIYIDGSKMKNSPSTGIACICPKLGYREIASINPLASIYTAETTAIRMAIDLANQDHSKRYVIYTDSLSAVQALNGKKFTSNTSHQIIKAKNSLKPSNKIHSQEMK